jgi:hypothetical protein
MDRALAVPALCQQVTPGLGQRLEGLVAWNGFLDGVVKFGGLVLFR